MLPDRPARSPDREALIRAIADLLLASGAELDAETRRRDRLRFGFRPDKPGKRPGFTDSTGEYRDTRTGWLRRQSRANPSLRARIPCQQGK